MTSSSEQSVASPVPPARPVRWDIWVAVGISVLVIAVFYALVPRFGAGRSFSAFGWLASAWNKENDYEHGIIFPFLIAGLIFYRAKELREAIGRGSWLGLVVVVVGALFYAAAYRTLQPRIAVGALPFLLWGGALFLWGWQVARLLAFPLFFFWLAIPLPGFQQATVWLQIIAAKGAHYGSSLFGVETVVRGTDILPVKGDWEPMSIAGGCSGIRSLMALLMISAAWAYVAKISLWKKVLLFLSAVPLAIIGNALRVISIFLIAEHGDAQWASTTWHDWSGLLLFYPFSLMLLLVIHSLLEGGLPWRAQNRRQLRRSLVTAAPLQGEP
ncbi:MAG: exosortase/archaeosortase family protein [Akkermansiaceae bacterium]|nr:exosortase/archaeosortase family protein [Akkermansiaceae bacterium]